MLIQTYLTSKCKNFLRKEESGESEPEDSKSDTTELQVINSSL